MKLVNCPTHLTCPTCSTHLTYPTVWQFGHQ
jgi:hypothetical protein